MPLTTFVALAILGIDFLIYAFFQWTYGEKRRARPRRRTASNSTANLQSPQPFPMRSRPVPRSRTNVWNERLAHHTIVSAFPPPRR